VIDVYWLKESQETKKAPICRRLVAKSMNQVYHGLWKSQEALEDLFATLSISLEWFDYKQEARRSCNICC
jgi:hypothetical protein